MSLYSLPRPSGFRLDATRNLYLDSRSGELIQTGRYQMPVPTTDAELVAQGWPSILGAVDGDLWLCDEGAGNLVGEINGYALAPQNAPLQGRLFNGLPYGGNLWSKAAVECIAAADRFQGTVAGVLNIAAEDFTFSVLLRFREIQPGVVNYNLLSKWAGGIGWQLYGFVGMLNLHLEDATGGTLHALAITPVLDSAVHLLTVSIDRNGNIATYYDDLATTLVAAERPGSLSNALAACLLGRADGVNTTLGQTAWAYVNIGVAASRVGHDALWAALNSDWLGTDNTYTRANPMTTRISNVMGYVATAGANQFMPGYNANASAGDNPLELGVVCEDGASFLGLGTTNMGAWVGTNAVVTATDGPSGMRDACRVADTDGVNAGYATSGAAVLAGATNVPFIYSAYVKSGGVGTNAVYQSYYTGDGGGPELFTNWTIAGAVGAAWRPFIGLTHTPVGAAHTAVVTRLIPTDNVGASLGTVDFAEVWGVQNSAVDRLAWRRCAAGAANVTSTPALSYTNLLNARYSPARGRLKLRVCGFAGTNGAVFLSFGAAAAAGSLVLDYSGGALRLRMWDDVAALIGTVTCGAVAAAERIFTIEWNAAAGTINVLEGAVVLGSMTPVVWVPEPNAITPIYVGSDSAGANAARCLVTLLEGWNF